MAPIKRTKCPECGLYSRPGEEIHREGCSKISPWWMCGRCGQKRTKHFHKCDEGEATRLASLVNLVETPFKSRRKGAKKEPLGDLFINPKL